MRQQSERHSSLVYTRSAILQFQSRACSRPWYHVFKILGVVSQGVGPAGVSDSLIKVTYVVIKTGYCRVR